MPAEKLYAKTGIQHMDFNSIFQLYTLKQRKDFGLTHAHRLLFMPDALSYLLTGNMVTEYTIASTSQLLNPETRQLDESLLDVLGVSKSLFAGMVEPGAKVGMLTKDLCEELQIEAVPVIAVAGHDTASAVAAIPAADKNFAYLSSGTWSLMGIETEGPVVNEKTSHYNITNEGGVDGTIRLLKNITGMWIVEQCLKNGIRKERIIRIRRWWSWLRLPVRLCVSLTRMIRDSPIRRICRRPSVNIAPVPDKRFRRHMVNSSVSSLRVWH